MENVSKEEFIAQLYDSIVGPDEPGLTYDNAYRALSKYGSSSDDHAIIARELMKSVNGGTDDPVKVSEWQAFWGRTSEEHGSLSSNFMKELSVRFGMWPLSVQMEKALKKIFFYLEASSKTGATSQSLIEAVEAVMGGDKAQHVVETVVFNFIPDYSPGQKLRMSEFLGFFARLYMDEGYPSSEKDEEKIKKALTRK